MNGRQNELCDSIGHIEGRKQEREKEQETAKRKAGSKKIITLE